MISLFRVGFYCSLFFAFSFSQLAKVQASSANVLFIGNSFTAYNGGIDRVLQQFDFTGACTPHTDRIAHFGYHLKWYLDNPGLLDKLIKRKWDVVILQEYSSGPIKNYQSFFSSVSTIKNKLDRRGNKTVLFMTWAYANKKDGHMTRQIANAYLQAGRELDVDVVPVGLAWQRVLDASDIVLYSDNKHPTPTGTYLAAAVFYSYLTQRSPVGQTAQLPLPQKDIHFLQEVAWETVQAFTKLARVYGTSVPEG